MIIEYKKPIEKLLTLRTHYMMLVRRRGTYIKQNDAKNDFIHTLKRLFTDHGNDTWWFKKELLNPESEGIYGSLTHVIIVDENIVMLEPSSTLFDDPVYYMIGIERSGLIRLADEWQVLADKKALIIYIYEHNNKFSVSDTLPEGIE